MQTNAETNPCNWSLQNKEAFLDLIEKMGVNSIWRPEAVERRLRGISCNAELSLDGKFLWLLGDRVPLTDPDYGEPGIYAGNLLQHIIDKCGFDERITSHMTGSGFYIRDVMSQLAVKWGINKNYL